MVNAVMLHYEPKGYHMIIFYYIADNSSLYGGAFSDYFLMNGQAIQGGESLSLEKSYGSMNGSELMKSG